MKVYVGDTRSRKLLAKIKTNGWGRICCRDKPDPFEGEDWALDNGAYVAWRKGERMDVSKFTKMIDHALDSGGCQMSVLPDIVAGGEESLQFSMRQLDKLPLMPWYLAVQDGMECQPLWGQVVTALKDERIKGVFLGGTNVFKLTVGLWRTTADITGKKLHYGRAGRPTKVAHALRGGADSLDSAGPLFDQRNWKVFEDALLGTAPQMELGELNKEIE